MNFFLFSAWCLQSRVRVLTEMQAPLSELRELVEEAEQLPAAMPEVDHIRVRHAGGRVWLGGCTA